MSKRIIATVTNDLNFDQRMIRICKSLVSFGYDVKLVGRELPSSVPLLEQPFDQFRIKCKRTSGPLFYLEYNIRLYRYLKKEEFELLNSIDLDTVLAALLLRRKKEVSWVLDAHEYFPEVPEVTNRPLVKAIWKYFERAALRKADIIYTVSGSIAKLYQKKFNREVEIIRNLPKLRSKNVVKPESEEVSIIYQGALNEGRCVDLYIKAMHRLNAHLYLAGEGDLSDPLRELVSRENLQEKVTFLGRLDPEALWQWTQKATMGLNVLENKGKSYFYSLSNKFFDYIQAGIPSLNSKFPEYVDLNDSYGVALFAEPNVDSIVEAISSILSDDERYKRIHENCTRAAKSLHWEEEEVKLKRIYEGI